MGDKEDSVSVDRFKPVFSTNPVVSAVPPTRGRPHHHPVVSPSVPVRPAIPSSTTVSPPAEDLPSLQQRNTWSLVRDHTSAPFSKSYGAPVGFLECSTHCYCYCLDYSILHLVYCCLINIYLVSFEYSVLLIHAY